MFSCGVGSVLFSSRGWHDFDHGQSQQGLIRSMDEQKITSVGRSSDLKSRFRPPTISSFWIKINLRSYTPPCLFLSVILSRLISKWCFLKQEASSFHCAPDCIWQMLAHRSLALNPASGHARVLGKCRETATFWGNFLRSLSPGVRSLHGNLGFHFKDWTLFFFFCSCHSWGGKFVRADI